MFVFFRQFLGPIVGGALVYGVGFRWMTGVRLHIRPVIVAYHFLIGRAGMNVLYNGKRSRIGANFRRETAANRSLVPPKDVTPINFMEKTFANGHKTNKSTCKLGVQSRTAILATEHIKNGVGRLQEIFVALIT